MAETKQQKAERMLREGRITVTKVGNGRAPIVALAKGDSGEMYQLGYDATLDRWGCTCPASKTFHRECAHLVALKRVVVKP
jgi:uncharacterized Zn finger protein